MKKEATFIASSESLPAILRWMRSHLSPFELETKLLHQIELALEEALVNIIQHGYGGKLAPIQIALELIPDERVSICLIDQGPAFNPLIAPVPNLNRETEEREVGGLGIHLIRQLMDEVLYERKQESNVLRLTKKITRSSQKR